MKDDELLQLDENFRYFICFYHHYFYLGDTKM